MIPALMANYQIPAERQKQYFQRLAHGLNHYFSRHYRPAASNENEEE
jgi:hypothetical protein